MPRAADGPPEGGSRAPVLCYVTDRKALAGDPTLAPLMESIRSAIAGGVDWVQIREKDLPARDVLSLAAAAIRAAADSNLRRLPARVIVNDRLDVALAAGAAGVHLGRESLPAAEVVRWCRSGNAPRDFLIGVSCHSESDVREAQAAGASYVFFGPVYETPSKQPFGPPQGIARLAAVCAAARLPVIAIGGINDENATECIRAGAAGVAAIRMYQQRSENLAGRLAKLHDLALQRG